MTLITALLGKDMSVKGKKPNMACRTCGKCWHIKLLRLISFHLNR